MGKGPSEQVTTTSSEPPAYVVPYIQHALAQGRNLYQNQGLYPSRELPWAAQQGFSQGIGQAMDPRLVEPAVGYAEDVIGGDYLSADALRDAARMELDAAIGGTRSAFEGMGRTGSGLAADALGKGVTAALGPAYQMERGLQQQMALGAPGMEGFRYQPSQQLVNLGMGQRGVEERYYQEPWDRWARYTGIALGNAPAQLAGGMQTMTQPIYQPSPFSQILGLGMTGLGAASGLGWRPFG